MEWVKLETLNLVRRLTSRPANQKIQKYVKKGVVYVTWPTFTFWDSFYITRIGKAKDFKSGEKIDREAYKLS